MNRKLGLINQYLNKFTRIKISLSSLTLLVGIISSASSVQAFEISVTRYNQFDSPINGFTNVFTNPFGENPNLDLLSVTSLEFPFIEVTNNNTAAVTVSGLTSFSVAPNSPYTITYDFQDNPNLNGFLITKYTVNLLTRNDRPTETVDDPLSLIGLYTQGPGYLAYYATIPNFRTVVLQAPGNSITLDNLLNKTVTPTVSVISIPQYTSNLDSLQFPPGRPVTINPGLPTQIKISSVPEPSTILGEGAIAALGIGAYLKRKLKG